MKRLAASLVVAGRENGYTDKQTRKVVVGAVRRYRDAMTSLNERDHATFTAAVEAGELPGAESGPS